jgi:N6-adenosine-specific RNA methylase IME4
MNDVVPFPDQTYGALKESLFLAQFTLERAFRSHLEPLIAGDAWRECGRGFDDINDFMDSLRLDKFKTIADERQAIVRRIKELQPGVSNRQLARTLGVSDMTIGRDLATNVASNAEKVADKDGASSKNVALSGEEAAALVRKREDYRRADERREARLEEISKANRDLPTGQRYPIIYADPPWRYEHPPMGGNRVVENHYPTMPLEEICALKVHELAADDAVLYLWATAPKLAECMKVIEAWGFVYRTNLVWAKDKIGMGYYARNQHEILLVARRGNIPPPAERDRVSSIVFGDRTEHSAKPPIFYELIERFYPSLAKIELFSRSPRPGWSVWGNQATARLMAIGS